MRILKSISILNLVSAVNSGFDSQDTIVKLQEESVATGEPVGLDINSGEVLKPQEGGIVDNFVVKKQIINSWYGLELFDLYCSM